MVFLLSSMLFLILSLLLHFLWGSGSRFCHLEEDELGLGLYIIPHIICLLLGTYDDDAFPGTQPGSWRIKLNLLYVQIDRVSEDKAGKGKRPYDAVCHINNTCPLSFSPHVTAYYTYYIYRALLSSPPDLYLLYYHTHVYLST